MEQKSASLLAALARHPGLIVEAVRAWRDSGREPEYRRWRLITAYGADNPPLLGTDLVHLLHWRRQMRRLRRW
ncbi:MAG: hypothetical protein ACE5F5_03885, partial [Acidimicrobiia bacterium]